MNMNMYMYIVLFYIIPLLFNMICISIKNWKYVDTIGELLFPDFDDNMNNYIVIWTPIVNFGLMICLIFNYLYYKCGVRTIIKKFLNIRIKK